MNTLQWKRSLLLIALGCLLLGVGGCFSYKIAVTVAPDGSGQRQQRLDGVNNLTEGEDISVAQLQQLYGLNEKAGWQPFYDENEAGSEEGEESQIKGFQRTIDVADLAAWQERRGDATICVAYPGQVNENVKLVNRISLEIGQSPRGHTYTYRETYLWFGLSEVLIDYLVGRLLEVMDSIYPELDSAAKAELRGLGIGLFTAIWLPAQGRGEEDDSIDRLIITLGPAAARIVQRQYPDATSEQIITAIEELAAGDDDDMERFTEEYLPGLKYAAWTQFQLEVQMPGRIVESNAHDSEGSLASWEFDGLGSCLAAPFEIFVRSELEE
jgi:hypothetical protein